MFRIRWLVPLIVLSGLTFAAGASVQSTADAVYWHGRIKELPEKKLGKLDVGDPQTLQYTWEKGAWKVPYSQIKTVYVSMSRRSALVELDIIVGAIASARKRKLLLSLNMTDEKGNNRNGVFYLPRGPLKEFLQQLEAKTGRRVVYESEEARRATEAEPEK